MIVVKLLKIKLSLWVIITLRVHLMCIFPYDRDISFL